MRFVILLENMVMPEIPKGKKMASGERLSKINLRIKLKRIQRRRPKHLNPSYTFKLLHSKVVQGGDDFNPG